MSVLIGSLVRKGAEYCGISGEEAGRSPGLPRGGGDIRFRPGLVSARRTSSGGRRGGRVVMDRAILLRSVRTYGAITGRRRHSSSCSGQCARVRPGLRRSIGNGARAKGPGKFDLFRLNNIPSGRKTEPVVGTRLGFESPDQATAQKVKVERSLPRTATGVCGRPGREFLSRRRADGTGTFCEMRRTCVRLGWSYDLHILAMGEPRSQRRRQRRPDRRSRADRMEGVLQAAPVRHGRSVRGSLHVRPRHLAYPRRTVA